MLLTSFTLTTFRRTILHGRRSTPATHCRPAFDNTPSSSVRADGGRGLSVLAPLADGCSAGILCCAGSCSLRSDAGFAPMMSAGATVEQETYPDQQLDWWNSQNPGAGYCAPVWLTFRARQFQGRIRELDWWDSENPGAGYCAPV